MEIYAINNNKDCRVGQLTINEDGHLRGSMKALRCALIFSRCFTVSKNTLPEGERRLQMLLHIKTTSNRPNWIKKMPDKNPPPHRCCCLLISSSATPLATSASCQSRRHSVDGWLVTKMENTLPSTIDFLYSLEGQTIPVEVQCPPPPPLFSSARSTVSSAPERHILQTLLQTKENLQLQRSRN